MAIDTGPGVGRGAIPFRRWYERQLYASFGWLTVCLACGGVFAGILEVVGLRRPGLAPYLTLIVLYLLGLLAFVAWRRFRQGWLRAQACAGRSTCERCEGNGLFDVVAGSRGLPVTCRRCGHRWHLLLKDEEAD